MTTNAAFVLAVGLTISSVIVSKGFSEMAEAIKFAGNNFTRGDLTLKVEGDDYRPLCIRQVQK